MNVSIKGKQDLKIKVQIKEEQHWHKDYVIF